MGPVGFEPAYGKVLLFVLI